VQTTRLWKLGTKYIILFVHSIAVQHRITNDLDSIHPQADISSIPNDAFIPDASDTNRYIHNLRH
jgi:hypothetical protein